MERPNKKPRLSQPSRGSDLPDEGLQEARARNDQRLKSLFEGIFEKYGKDFSDVGDEINLQTGEIIVNKGHVLGMEHEVDVGRGFQPQKMTSQSREPSLTPKDMDDDDDSSVDLLIDDKIAVREDQHRSEPELGIPSLHYPLELSMNSKALDPLWQVPDIDVKFSVPTLTRNQPRPEPTLPRRRSVSPPTAGSLWAIPTPGRRPNTDTKKKQRTPVVRTVVRTKRKRKRPAVRDWSFAQRQDGSDSDDPLHEDFTSPVKSTSNLRNPGSIAVTPTPTKSKARIHRTHSVGFEGHGQDSLNTVQGSTMQTQDNVRTTPESVLLSPRTQDSAPTVDTRPSDQNSTTEIEDEMTILTPDEVRLIAHMRRNERDIGWQAVIDRLPGRTLDDLHNWDRLRRQIVESSLILADQIWLEEELEKLRAFKDQSGISWNDMQTQLPGRSQEEIEHQILRLWAGDKTQGDRTPPNQHEIPNSAFKDGQVTPHSVPKKRKQSNLLTPRKLSAHTGVPAFHFEDLLAYNSDDSDATSGISSIKIDNKPGETTPGSRRGSRKGSPIKAPVSPLKRYYSDAP